MAEEVTKPEEEVHETAQPGSENQPQALSEEDQERIFNEALDEADRKEADRKEADQNKPSAEEKPAEEQKKTDVPVVKETPAPDAEKTAEAEKIAADKLLADEAAEKASKDAEDTARKAAEEKAIQDALKSSDPVKYEELMPKLRQELSAMEVPVLDADGKPTDQKTSIGDLLETYGEDVVPLITAIMNSKAMRDTMKVAVPAAQKPEIPKDMAEHMAAMSQRQAFVDLCLTLSSPEYGGHVDAFTIATGKPFGEWLAKQPEAVRQKAHTSDPNSNREVLEAYKKEKGLMQDKEKIEQDRKNREEEELLSVTASGGGRGAVSAKGKVASEQDLDAAFDAEAAK